jgi:hypothetical protein
MTSKRLPDGVAPGFMSTKKPPKRRHLGLIGCGKKKIWSDGATLRDR